MKSALLVQPEQLLWWFTIPANTNILVVTLNVDAFVYLQEKENTVYIDGGHKQRDQL